MNSKTAFNIFQCKEVKFDLCKSGKSGKFKNFNELDSYFSEASSSYNSFFIDNYWKYCCF